MVFNMKSIFLKSFIVTVLLTGSSAWAGGPQDFWFEGAEDLKVPMPQMNHPQDSLFLGDEGNSWVEDDTLFLPLPLVNVLSEPQQVSNFVSSVPPMDRVKVCISTRLLHYSFYEEEVVMPRVVYTPAFTEDSEGSPNNFKENRGPRKKQFTWPSHLVQKIEELRVAGKDCSEMMGVIWLQLDPWEKNYFLNDEKSLKFRKSVDARTRNNLRRAKEAERKAARKASKHNIK